MTKAIENSTQSPTPPKIRKSRWRRWILRPLKIALIVFVCLCLLAYLAQNWMIFPAHWSQGTTEAEIHPPIGATLLHLRTKTGIPIAAVFGPALLPDGSPDPHPNTRPTILYFYGNGSSVAWSWNEFAVFRRLDANVLIPDFAGYGMSGGKPSETTFYATADAAYSYLMDHPKLDHSTIIIFGWSLGSAVAIDLASRQPVAGLAVFNAFTTMPAMAHKILPWLPAASLVSYKFDNLSKIANVHCPIFICNGARDTLVPPAMSNKLAAAAAGPVTRLVLPLANHVTIFTANRAMLLPALKRFVDRVAVGQ